MARRGKHTRAHLYAEYYFRHSAKFRNTRREALARRRQNFTAKFAEWYTRTLGKLSNVRARNGRNLSRVFCLPSGRYKDTRQTNNTVSARSNCTARHVARSYAECPVCAECVLWSCRRLYLRRVPAAGDTRRKRATPTFPVMPSALCRAHSANSSYAECVCVPSVFWHVVGVHSSMPSGPCFGTRHIRIDSAIFDFPVVYNPAYMICS